MIICPLPTGTCTIGAWAARFELLAKIVRRAALSVRGKTQLFIGAGLIDEAAKVTRSGFRTGYQDYGGGKYFRNRSKFLQCFVASVVAQKLC